MQDYSPVVFDPSRHIVRNDSGWLRSMRVQTGREDLGLYQHRVTQNWVLFTLQNGIFLNEMCCMPACPDSMRVVCDMDGEPITADDIRWALRPALQIAEEKRDASKSEWRTVRNVIADKERELQKVRENAEKGRIVLATR